MEYKKLDEMIAEAFADEANGNEFFEAHGIEDVDQYLDEQYKVIKRKIKEQQEKKTYNFPRNCDIVVLLKNDDAGLDVAFIKDAATKMNPGSESSMLITRDFTGCYDFLITNRAFKDLDSGFYDFINALGDMIIKYGTANKVVTYKGYNIGFIR